MTTIAYRDGVMAADSGCWIGDARHGWARKLARGPDGGLYGCAGNAAQVRAFLAWVDAGYVGVRPEPEREKDDGNSFIVLVAAPSGPLRLITARGEEEHEAPYFAIGAGCVAAFGAMFAGATAETAIAAAIEHASGAMGQVQSVRR